MIQETNIRHCYDRLDYGCQLYNIEKLRRVRSGFVWNKHDFQLDCGRGCTADRVLLKRARCGFDPSIDRTHQSACFYMRPTSIFISHEFWSRILLSAVAENIYNKHF